jgi:hypothetical protein
MVTKVEKFVLGDWERAMQTIPARDNCVNIKNAPESK